MRTRLMARRAARASLVRGRRIARRVDRRARAAGLLPVRPAVLMYHRVTTEQVDPWGLTVSPERFDEQLAWLSDHRVVLPLAEFARLHVGSRLPARAVAITFDDGYACNALTAAPLLTRHDAAATIFVTTGPVLAGHEYWWDDLQRMVFDAPVDRLEVTTDALDVSVELGDRPAEHGWASGAAAGNQRQRAYMELWRAIRSLEPVAQTGALAALRRQTGTPVEPRSTHRPMTVEELTALARSGVVDIGGHTATHPALPERSEAIQRTEIEDGRDALAAMTGRVPTTFAYPFGDHDESTVRAVRAAGFQAACTTEVAPVTRRQDVLRLPRLQVEDWSADRLADELRSL